MNTGRRNCNNNIAALNIVFFSRPASTRQLDTAIAVERIEAHLDNALLHFLDRLSEAFFLARRCSEGIREKRSEHAFIYRGKDIAEMMKNDARRIQELEELFAWMDTNDDGSQRIGGHLVNQVCEPKSICWW